MKLPGSRVAITLLAIGGATATVLGGSYATWTSQQTNPGNAVTAGTLSLTNSRNAAALISASGITPGATGTETVTVRNAGTVPALVKLTQDTVSASGIEGSLRLSVYDSTADYCYHQSSGPASGACGTLGAWNAASALNAAALAGTSAASWAAGEQHSFTVKWELVSSSPNSDQGKTGSFRLVWDATTTA